MIHGCVDGFSRVITYLHCSTNNKAETVLQLFFQAGQKYGLSSKMRSDHGTENVKVALFINLVRGRSSRITGASAHNQCIERLWRDVHTNAIEYFQSVFYGMEEHGNLNPDDRRHRYALHYIYLEDIKMNVALDGMSTN